MATSDKFELYQELCAQLASLLADERDLIANAAEFAPVIESFRAHEENGGR